MWGIELLTWHKLFALFGAFCFLFFPTPKKMGEEVDSQGWGHIQPVSMVSKTIMERYSGASSNCLWKSTVKAATIQFLSTSWDRCFHGFSKGHISIALMGINSCSTNLQHTGGYRHREQREMQGSHDWLTWRRLGQGWHLVPLHFSILLNADTQAAAQSLPHFHLNLQEEW